MNKPIRLLALLLAVALMTGLTAGCGQNNEPEETGSVAGIFNQYQNTDKLYLNLAKFAVDDLLTNFFVEEENNDHFLPTHDGIWKDDIPKGSLWESAMLIYPVYDMWVITGDEVYAHALSSHAQWLKNNFQAASLENPAGPPGPATDDCAWCCMMFLIFYEVTGDEWFVERTINLLDNSVERWYDEHLGGLYYKDGVDFMSLYECGMTLSWLRLWEIKGDQRFYDLALRSYENMHKRLLRSDGIYFIECNKFWPTSGDENRITEGGSSSFLAGNMAMAALSAKFYKITGNQEYLDRVYATNEGLLQWYDTDGDGVLLNDRDGWTNGTFAAFYAAEVLSLPDTEEMQKLLKSTAESIVRNCRTEDGYYGASWQGPAEGPSSIWHSKGTTANQSKTSGSTVMMVTAAAILEAKLEEFVR